MNKINHLKVVTSIKVRAMTPKLFELGRLVMTPGTLALATAGADFGPLVERHASGDWGDIPVKDWAANDAGIATGGFLLSCYTIGSREVWVHTERDRSITTIFLPEEY